MMSDIFILFLGAINKTAGDIEVKSYKPPPPPKLRDFMNPEIRERMYDTDNMFQQEQLTGTYTVFLQINALMAL